MTKNKGKLTSELAFLLLHIIGEPFNADTENAGKYDEFIICYETKACFYAADGLTPNAETGKLELCGQRIL